MNIWGVCAFNIWLLPREYACFQKIDVSRKGIENGGQKGAKMTSKSSFGRSRDRFLWFWVDFGGVWFWTNFWSAKSWSTICKNATLGGQREFFGVFGCGSARGFGLLEGLSRVVRILHEFRHWILHAHAPASRGRRIKRAPPHPPTPKCEKEIKSSN